MRVGAAVLVLAAAGFAATSLEVPYTLADPPVTGQPATVYRDQQTVTVNARSHGHSGGYWYMRLRQTRVHLRASVLQQHYLRQKSRKQTLALQRRWTPTVSGALAYARVVYGVDQSRRVSCESHGNPFAHNASGATGLLQFLPSTWRTTPFAGFSIYDPVAQALAGGWMIRAGRSGEWTCSL